MTRYILGRLLAAVITLWIVTLLAFVALRVAPGDAIDAKIGEAAFYDEEYAEELRSELGLDKSLPEQYIQWLGGVLTGDFGTSFSSDRPTMELLLKRAPASLEMAIFSVLLSVLIALPAGIVAAHNSNRWPDQLIRVIATAGLAIPVFVIGTAMIVIPAREWSWVPPAGYDYPWDDPVLNIRQIWLPVLALSSHIVAVFIRVTRTSMLDVFNEEYVTVARSKGLRESVVVYRHAVKNALIPVVSITGLLLAATVGGVVVTERIFSIPGLGSLTLEALANRDYAQVQTNVFWIAVAVIGINLITDLSYGLIDPRVRYG